MPQPHDKLKKRKKKKKEVNFLKKEIRQVFEGKASKGLSSSVVVIAVIVT